MALLDDGADVYRDVAADIYRLDKLAFMAIAKDQLTPDQNEQRQIGKGTIIGCGFGLGWPTFHQLHCPHMSEEFAQKVIDTYRNVWAPRVPLLWRDLERAALRAMFNPGKVSEADCGIQYRLETKAGLPFLVCKLFNGKKFHYCNARVEEPDEMGRHADIDNVLGDEGSPLAQGRRLARSSDRECRAGTRPRVPG